MTDVVNYKLFENSLRIVGIDEKQGMLMGIIKKIASAHEIKSLNL